MHYHLILRGTTLGEVRSTYRTRGEASEVLRHAYFDLKGCTDDSEVLACERSTCALLPDNRMVDRPRTSGGSGILDCADTSTSVALFRHPA
jgi:hypothetical protein